MYHLFVLFYIFLCILVARSKYLDPEPYDFENLNENLLNYDEKFSHLELFYKKIEINNILSYYNKYDERRLSYKTYPGEVLAFVTPWNKRGYAMAELMAAKIDFLVPAWFQIR